MVLKLLVLLYGFLASFFNYLFYFSMFVLYFLFIYTFCVKFCFSLALFITFRFKSTIFLDRLLIVGLNGIFSIEAFLDSYFFVSISSCLLNIYSKWLLFEYFLTFLWLADYVSMRWDFLIYYY